MGRGERGRESRSDVAHVDPSLRDGCPRCRALIRCLSPFLATKGSTPAGSSSYVFREGIGRWVGESEDASRGATSPTISRYRTYSFALIGDGSAGQNGELRLERIATIATQTTHDPTE